MEYHLVNRVYNLRLFTLSNSSTCTFHSSDFHNNQIKITTHPLAIYIHYCIVLHYLRHTYNITHVKTRLKKVNKKQMWNGIKGINIWDKIDATYTEIHTDHSLIIIIIIWRKYKLTFHVSHSRLKSNDREYCVNCSLLVEAKNLENNWFDDFAYVRLRKVMKGEQLSSEKWWYHY